MNAWVPQQSVRHCIFSDTTKPIIYHFCSHLSNSSAAFYRDKDEKLSQAQSYNIPTQVSRKTKRKQTRKDENIWLWSNTIREWECYFYYLYLLRLHRWKRRWWCENIHVHHLSRQKQVTLHLCIYFFFV